MSWNYNSSLPAALDKVRFLVLDTDEADQLVQDEEITFALSENGSNLYRSAASVARSVALKLGRRPTARLGQIGLDANEQYQHYMDMAKEFDSKVSLSGAVGVFAGGISVSDMQSRRDDSDRTKDQFTTGLHQSP